MTFDSAEVHRTGAPTASPARPPDDTPPANLWRNGDFLRLWTGETVSQVGSQISLIALPLTAIITLNATPQQVGLLTAAQFAPVFVATLFAGVWLDTHRRRPVLLATNLGRMLLLAAVPALYLLDRLDLTLLYLIAFLVGLLTAVFDVAYVVYLPSLVHQRQLVEANAKLEATYSVSQVGGPAVGGALVQAVTAPIAVVVDAVSYLLAALSIGGIRRPEPVPSADRPRRGVVAEIRQGFSATLADPPIRALVAESAWFNLGEQVVLTLYLLYGVRELHLSPGLLGALLGIGSAGAVVGTLVAGWAGRTFGIGPTLVGSMLLGSAALALVPAAHGSRTQAVTLLAVGLTVYGLGLAVFNVHNLSLRAALIPPELFARVTATYRFISFGAIPVGGLAAGFLGGALGVRAAMAVAVAALVAGAAVFATSRIRRIRTLEQRT
jgi:MFS family permease